MSISPSQTARISPDAPLSPARILIARQRRGLKKTELAQLLELTPRRISTYETEGAPLSSAPKLADALEFPVEYFQRGHITDLSAAEVNFRAGRLATAAHRNAAKAAGSLAMEIAGWIDEHFSLPSQSLPDLSGHEPKLAARLLREAWGLGTKPLPNLVQLAESRGIRMYSLPALAEEVDAYSAWHSATPFIFLARRKTPERSRFDVAHEIGHLVLHSGESADSTQEREANTFASEFLIPRTSIIEYLHQSPPVDTLMDFKKAFRVSAMAATYAAHKAGRLSDWGYRQNCAELDRRGYRTGEPVGMAAHEASRVFPQVMASGKFSAKTIASETSLPLDEVHALTFSTSLHAVRAGEVEPTVFKAAMHRRVSPLRSV